MDTKEKFGGAKHKIAASTTERVSRRAGVPGLSVTNGSQGFERGGGRERANAADGRKAARGHDPKRCSVSPPVKRETRNKLRRQSYARFGARMIAKVCTWRRQTFGAGINPARSQNREKASALRRAAPSFNSAASRRPMRQSFLQPSASRLGSPAQNPGSCPEHPASPLPQQPISWRASFGATPRARRDVAAPRRALSCARGERPRTLCAAVKSRDRRWPTC